MATFRPRVPLRRLVALLALAVASAVVPAAAQRPQMPPGADRTERPVAVVVHAPGISGPRWIDRQMTRGLIDGGAAAEVEIVDWVGDRAELQALTGYEENRRQARQVAERLADLGQRQPDRPVVLTGHSGGTAIVTWALEMLPDVLAERAAPGEPPPPAPKVAGLILIASALSPGYDLSAALARVEGTAWSVSSDLDGVVLGTGTSLFGTMDRQWVESAGRFGFYRPAGVTAEAYARLVEVPYDPAFAPLGNTGSHLGPMRYEFSRLVLTDLVRASVARSRQGGDARAAEGDLPTTRPIPAVEDLEAMPIRPKLTRPAGAPVPEGDAGGQGVTGG